METFEVHITGDQSIISVCEPLKLKTIAVDLLRPDMSVLRTEYMTSYEKKSPSYEVCYAEIEGLAAHLKKKGVKVIRTKIESPPYEHYIDQSWYIESHFEAEASDGFPLSLNQKKSTYMGTDRAYRREHYANFIEDWQNETVEICLFDDFVMEDADWFEAWRKL